MITQFSMSALPKIEFGSGVFQKIPHILQTYGKRVLLVTGKHSFINSPRWIECQDSFTRQGLQLEHVFVTGEPSPQFVDSIVQQYQSSEIHVVLGIGGGSALDAAKAIAGLLRIGCSVMNYLEGVGPELAYQGPSVPFIAVPTTAGTGSELTKNSVLSLRGEAGFKKSFRDEKLIAREAVVDPELLSSCPPDVIAANGMDALTQLLESFVSTKSNPFTDALACSGLNSIREGLLSWYQTGGPNLTAQTHMAYAAMVSGITLAQVGLGSVHGLASPLGAFYPIPHGVVCGTLVADATQVNIASMLKREPDNSALGKYVMASEILCQKNFASKEAAWQALLDKLFEWKKLLKLSGLANYGVKPDDINNIIRHSRGSSMRTNPIVLTDEEIGNILTVCF